MWERTLFSVLSELHSYIGHNWKYPYKRNFDNATNRILAIWNFDIPKYDHQSDAVKEIVETEINWAKRIAENN